MNALINNFASESKTIRNAVADLLKIKAESPKSYRLGVNTPFDANKPILGLYKLEANVFLALMDTMYAEVVSMANRTTRRDTMIPVADRGRSLSGFDDTYDGQDEQEVTEQQIEDSLDNALDRAAFILAYGKHIAAIKEGGAEWLAGFEVDRWIARDAKDEEAALQCKLPGADLSKLITEHRVIKVQETVQNRLMNLNAWIDAQLKRENIDVNWRMKLSYARAQNYELDHVDVSTSMDYIGDIVSKSAFNRETSRLEDAIGRVANRKYLQIAYAITNGVSSEIKAALSSGILALPYSSMLQSDIEDLHASEEWQDHQLSLDVQKAEADAKQELRNAIRAQTMFNIEKQAKAIAGIKAQAAGIYALINKEKDEINKADKAVKEATKAAKPKTTKAKAAKVAAKKSTKGIAGTKIPFAGSNVVN